MGKTIVQCQVLPMPEKEKNVVYTNEIFDFEVVVIKQNDESIIGSISTVKDDWCALITGQKPKYYSTLPDAMHEINKNYPQTTFHVDRVIDNME